MSFNKYIIKTFVGLKGKLPGNLDSIFEVNIGNEITIVRPVSKPQICEDCMKDKKKQIGSESDKEVETKSNNPDDKKEQ